MAEWFENEEFWEELYPFVFSQERLSDAVWEIEQLLGLVQVTEGKVLDLACGPGRHAIELAKHGLHVTGVDQSEYLLAQARERARTEGGAIEFIRADMREYIDPGTFDLVVNLYSSFGYFETEEEDLLVAENICESLTDGGVCVIDLRGKEIVARDFQSAIPHDLEDGSTLITRHHVLPGWSQLQNEWIHIDEGYARSFEFTLRLYSGDELRSLLKDAGFQTVELFGNLSGHPYDLEAMRLIGVARK